MPLILNTPYNVAAPVWPIAGCTFDSSYDVSTHGCIRPVDMKFKDDGTKAYVLDTDTDYVYQFSLSTPYDFTAGSVSYDGDGERFYVGNENINPAGAAWSSDGLFYYMVKQGGGAGSASLFQYDPTIPWDISTCGLDQSVLINGTYGGHVLNQASGIYFSQNGDKMFISDNGSDGVFQFSLSPTWVASSFTYDKFLASPVAGLLGLSFSPDGKQLFMVEDNTNRVYQYILPNAWNLTGAVAGDDCLITGETYPHDATFNPDGTSMYISGFATSAIRKYV